MLKRFGFDASCLQQGHFFYKKLGIHIRLACILLAFSICEGKMIHFTICWFAKMLGIPVPKREAIKSQSPLYDFFAGMVRFIVPARKIIKWDRFSKEPNIDSFEKRSHLMVFCAGTVNRTIPVEKNRKVETGA